MSKKTNTTVTQSIDIFLKKIIGYNEDIEHLRK